MLNIFQKLDQIHFGKLMEVYAESNEENAKIDQIGVLDVEQRFYQYLREDFFRIKGSFYAVWEEDDRYVSALRMEPYRDGFLLEALETAPCYRRRGFAARLIRAALELLPGRRIYSHVNKRNIPSLKAHEKCGFRRISDHAVYIDGSVMGNSYTLAYIPGNS